MIEFWSKICRF